MGFHHVDQDDLDLLPGDPPASASQSAGITGLSHRARPCLASFTYVSKVYPYRSTFMTELYSIVWLHYSLFIDLLLDIWGALGYYLRCYYDSHFLFFF